MFEKLKKLNPDIEFYDANDNEFASFGRVITSLDIDEIVAESKNIEFPKEGSVYLPSVPEFETLRVAKKIETEFFGTSESQLGFCYGHNSFLNATEWHICSEINIAVTPLVLILGHIWDIKDGEIDSSKFKAFYLPQGTVAEVYSTSLHFCPCEVTKDGFGCVVGLLKGTNTNLETVPENKMLFRVNKWIIAHKENNVLLEKGVVPGISGVNFEIKY